MKNLVVNRTYRKDGGLSDLCIKACYADSFLTRFRGLLGSHQLLDSEGLLLDRCSSVHTIGMNYPLDIVFMDRSGKVLKCVEMLKPFRASLSVFAYYALELNGGVIKKHDIQADDLFEWEAI